MLATFTKVVQSPGRCIYMSCSHTSDCNVDLTSTGFTPELSLASWDGRSCSRERTLWRRICLVNQQDDQHCMLRLPAAKHCCDISPTSQQPLWTTHFDGGPVPQRVDCLHQSCQHQSLRHHSWPLRALLKNLDTSYPAEACQPEGHLRVRLMSQKE